MDPYRILNWPHMTEKSVSLIEKENKIVFIVNRQANKKQVKDAFILLEVMGSDHCPVGVEIEINPAQNQQFHVVHTQFSSEYQHQGNHVLF